MYKDKKEEVGYNKWDTPIGVKLRILIYEEMDGDDPCVMREQTQRGGGRGGGGGGLEGI